MQTTTAPRYRATFTLPAPLATDISRLAKRLGVSQSSLLTELLTDPIAAMCDVVDGIPQVGVTSEHIHRARGKSAALIKRAVAEALALADGTVPE